MENYLIFFGKSQDFTFEVFDENGIINKLDTIFVNFHLLESQLFTIDDVSNKEILAKYNFIGSNNKKYSLLKLYSLAQAFDGTRISGSTFGVAFLSSSNLKITTTNNKLLKLLKSEFAKLSLNNKKFNKSNFGDDVTKIWKSFQKEDYFKKIVITEPIIISQNTVNQKVFLVGDIYSDSIELDNEINNASKLYFSNDLKHLQRTEKKWGSKFNFYHKVNNTYIQYLEEIIKTSLPPKRDNEKSINDYKIENSDLKYDNQELRKQLEKSKKYFKKKIKLFTAITFLLLLSTVTFFFTDSFIFNKETEHINSETSDLSPKEKRKSEEQKGDINNSIVRIDILDNNDIDRLSKLQTNLSDFNKAKDNAKSIKVFDAIRRDCDSLGISLLKFEEKHHKLKVKSDSIKKMLNDKYLDSLKTKIELKKYLNYIDKTNLEKLSKTQNNTLRNLRLKVIKRMKNAN